MTAREKELEARLAAAEKRADAAEKQVDELLGRISILEAKIAQLTRNSSNSSKPPSSNPPGSAAQKKKIADRKKRKRGGQVGHKGSRREFLAPDTTEHLIPKTCSQCHSALTEKDDNPARYQQVEMPPVKAVVTDYFCHTVKCRCCGKPETAPLPQVLQTGSFGPNICALVGLLSGRYRLSKRLIRELMTDVFGINMALGTVSNIEQRLSRALAEPVEEAAHFIREQKTVHADETGWTEDKSKAWMWVVACPQVAVFAIDMSRGSDVAKRLLGISFRGTLVSDRWGGYAWLDPRQRQLCWSHLLRDFQSWIDDAKIGEIYGTHLKTRIGRIFRLWHALKSGSISREVFRTRVRKHQIMVATYLDEAARCGDSRTMAMAKRILKLERALWSFIDTENVEPTNNYAERLIRPAVIWRKVSFGTDSVVGSQFVERMLTAVMTLRLQSRSVLGFLRESLLASQEFNCRPSLLPC